MKTYRFKNRIWGACLLSALMLSACGGGGGGDTGGGNPGGGTAPAAVGTLVDSRVAGISYQTESSSGVTDENGQFPYVDGETVIFSIGDIVLPAIPVQRTISPLDIFGATNSSDTRVVNFARYIQSIDADGDPSNGITIEAAAHTAATGASIDFSSVTFDTDIAGVVAGTGDTLIDGATALFLPAVKIKRTDHTGLPKPVGHDSCVGC